MRYKAYLFDEFDNIIESLEGNNTTFMAKLLRRRDDVKAIMINNEYAKIEDLGDFTSFTLEKLAKGVLK